MSAFSLPKISAAMAAESSVLPTPVFPINMNDPMGRRGFFRPILPRRIERATADIASLCPTTLFFRFSSRFRRRVFSSSRIFSTGIPVHSVTTSAISDLLTVTGSPSASVLVCCCSSFSCFFSCVSLSLTAAASSKFCLSIAFTFCSDRSESLASIAEARGLGVQLFILCFAAASSIRSIALSGRNLS